MHRPATTEILILAVLATLAAAATLLLASGSSRKDRPGRSGRQGVQYDPNAFATGDLVFRRGRDLVSSLVLASEDGGNYSHVGIIWRSDGTPYVIHTLPPEDDDAGLGGGARVEPLSAFLAPLVARAAGLYRLRGSGDAPARASAAALAYAMRQVPFDSAFDLTSDSRLYCTELAWRAFKTAGVDLVDGHFDRLPLPGLSGPVLLPSRLSQSPHLRLVAFFQEQE